ncbi:MAG TPA: hypothetical protein VLI90_04980, partial [Tepidisphaeraceae bacterium]|nr:hypothetical protein [Tepidisphaeraceae bacterium]
HDLTKLPLPVIELAAVDTRIEGLAHMAPFCPAALEQTANYLFVSVRPDGSFELKAERPRRS